MTKHTSARKWSSAHR